MVGSRGAVAGLLLALASAAAFGTSGSLAGSLLGSGWSPGAAVLARIGMAALILTPWALAQLRGRWSLLQANALVIGLFGLLAVAGAQLFFFLAVDRVPVAVAILLEYSGVLLVVGYLWLRHGQRPGPRTVAGGLTALVGLILVLNLLGGVRLDLLGVVWGLLAATGLATYYVLAARVDGALPPLVTAWAGMVVATLGLAAAGVVGVLPMAAATDAVTLAGADLPWWVPVLGLAALAGAFAYVSGIVAVQLLGSRVSSFVGLTEVLFAVLIAWLLLAQAPAPVQALGGLLVIAGVALVRAERTVPVDSEPLPDAVR